MMTIDPKVKKGKRPPACAQCRRRKIGCDRIRPVCGNCIKYHKKRCIYPDEDAAAFNDYINQPSAHPHQTHRISSSDTSSSSNNNNENSVIGSASFKITNMSNHIDSNKHLPNNEMGMTNTMNSPALSLSSTQSSIKVEQPLLQQVKFHKVQEPPVYQPPVIVQPQVFEIPKVKHSRNKNNIPMNNAQDSISLEQIGGYNTMKHMMQLNKAIQNLQNSVLMDQTSVKYDIMPSAHKQDDILLKEMEYLENRFIELQKYRKRMYPHVSKKKQKTKKQRNDGSNTTQQENTAVNITQRTEPANLKGEEILSFINLYTGVPSGSQNELLIKDTPNSIFTINFLVNRDSYLTKYYGDLQNYIIVNFKDQLTQFKQKQFNEVNKRMGNSKEEKDLLQRLLNKLTYDIPESISPERVSLIGFLYSTLDIELTQPKQLKELLIKQFIEYYDRDDTTGNHFSKIAKFGTLLIILLFDMMINNIGTDPEIEVLTRKLNYISDEVKTIQDRSVLLEDSSILKFLILRNFYHDMIEDFDQINYLDIDHEVYLAKWSQSNQITNDLRFLTFRNYINRSISTGTLPSMLSLEELKESIIDVTNVPEKIRDIELWEKEIAILTMIESRGSGSTSIKQLNKLIKELETKYKELHEHENETNDISKVINFQNYHKLHLYINCFLLLQYELLKDHDSFYSVLLKLLKNMGIIIQRQFSSINSCKTFFIKKDFIILETICEILFSLDLRCESIINVSNEYSSVSEDLHLGIKILQGKLINFFCKIVIVLQEKYQSKKPANKLKIKLLNYIKWLQLQKKNETPRRNGMLLLTSSELSNLSETFQTASNVIIDEIEDEKFYTERKQIIEKITTEATTDANFYGLSKDTFNDVFEAIFQK